MLGLPLVFNTLQWRLQSMGKSIAGADQWRKTIENFQKKGVRASTTKKIMIIINT